ncbi:hypothetical protein EPO15_09745, partial [bacterium]
QPRRRGHARDAALRRGRPPRRTGPRGHGGQRLLGAIRPPAPFRLGRLRRDARGRGVLVRRSARLRRRPRSGPLPRPDSGEVHVSYARFANPAVVTQGWYCAGPAKGLAAAAPSAADLFGRRIVLWRDEGGAVRAADARCAHLGADLSLGTVTAGRLTCGFHQWTYDGEGRCVACPSAYAGVPRPRARVFPAAERWGALWVFAGPEPLFPLPAFSGLRGPEAAWGLPPAKMNAHPHVITMNGLDIHHFRAVHGLEFVGEPVLDRPDAFRTRLTLKARVGGHGLLAGLVRRLSGGVVEAAFTTYGANLAVIEGKAGRVPVRVVFSHAPRPEGGSLSRTFLVGERGPAGFPERLAAALAMAHILSGDREVLDRIDFHPGFAPADAALSAFAAAAEALPTVDEPSEARRG